MTRRTTIDSAHNPQWRRWLHLASQPRAVKQQQSTLAEGVHLARAALAARHPINAVVVRRGVDASAETELADVLIRLETAGVARFDLAATLYDRIAPVENGVGVLLEIATMSANVTERAAIDAIYLDGIQDPGNVGSILRSAGAAGVKRVLAGPGTAALWSPRVIRAAMGAHFQLELVESIAPESLPQAITGDWIATVPAAAVSLWDTAFDTASVGWVFGSEGQGVTAAAAAICAQRIMIPLMEGTESLGVAAAAAVCLFERSRQRDHAGTGRRNAA